MTTTEPGPVTSGARHRRGRSIARRSAAVLAALLTGTAALSYGQALTYPGDAGWQVRTVEWVRDNGGGGLVDAVENWWYADNAPTGVAPPAGSLPSPAAEAPPVVAAGAAPAPLPLLPGVAPLTGEAQWVPGPQPAGAAPALYTGYFRPDPAYPSQIAGVAWLDQTRTVTHLIAGTREPGGGVRPDQAQVPPELRSTLVAAFNSGWKMADARGGYFADGRTAIPLRDGAASLVIDASGRVTIGQWGRHVSMNPQVVAVRQNLDLIVDGGRPVPGLADNAGGAWGSAHNQFQYTWRSGVGTDRAGNLIYLGGDKLTLAGLAGAMAAAGVQTGMELDIHPDMVTFNTYQPAPAKLLPAMTQPATRYLTPDQRDFLAVTLRPANPVRAR